MVLGGRSVLLKMSVAKSCAMHYPQCPGNLRSVVARHPLPIVETAEEAADHDSLVKSRAAITKDFGPPPEQVSGQRKH